MVPAGMMSICRAWISPSWVDSTVVCAPAPQQRAARLLELDALDAVGGEDGDPEVLQFMSHGERP